MKRLPCINIWLLLYIAILMFVAPSVALSATDTIYEYDDLNRLTKEIYPDGTAVEYGYDKRGRRTSRNITVNSLFITAEAGPNGDISPKGSVIVSTGGAREFTITPAADYDISDVKVNGDSVGAVSAYTISNVQTNNNKINATFKPKKYQLTAIKNENAGGTITLDGISCGDGCSQLSQPYDYGTENVTLTASPNEAYNFNGWTGCASVQSNACTVTIDAAKTVTANFSIKTFTITATAAGYGSITDGTKTILSNTTGAITVNYGGEKTFTVTPNSGLYHITDITINEETIGALGSFKLENITKNYSITVAFARTSADLTVEVIYADGSTEGGKVTGKSGLTSNECGKSCTDLYEKNSTVMLEAVADYGYEFQSWAKTCIDTVSCKEACTGTNKTCSFVLNEDKKATATFKKAKFTLTVNKNIGTGGSVKFKESDDTSDNYANCGSTCGNNYPYKTTVQFTAKANIGFGFVTWSGCNPVPNYPDQCTVTLDGAKTVTALFERKTVALTVRKHTSFWDQRKSAQCAKTHSGDKVGGYTVSNPSSSQTCTTADCSIYGKGEIVSLSAVPYEGYEFTGWTEGKDTPLTIKACEGLDTCQVTLDQNKDVTANFKAKIFRPKCSYPIYGGTAENSRADDIYDFADYGSDIAFKNITPPDGYEAKLLIINDTSFPIKSDATGSTKIIRENSKTGTGFDLYICNITEEITASVTFYKSKEFKTLTVNNKDTEFGKVRDNSPDAPAIDCGLGADKCIAPYEDGTTVILTAEAADNHYEFTGWGKACSGIISACSVNMNSAKTVTANFALKKYDLTVSKTTNDGKDGGKVSDSGKFDDGTTITATATPKAAYYVAGWDGCDSIENVEKAENFNGPNKNGCKVAMTQARTVTAHFAIKTYTIAASMQGDGGSIVTSGAFDSGSKQSLTVKANYDSKQSLTCKADPGYYIVAVEVDGVVNNLTKKTQTYTRSFSDIREDHTIIARFAAIVSYTLSVDNTHDSKQKKVGNVISSPMGISCGNACKTSYDEDEVVTLTAAVTDEKKKDYYNIEWTGCDSAQDSTCTVTMNQNKNVAVNFNPKTYSFAVSKTTSDGAEGGTVKGTVTSSSAKGIACGNNCSQTYDHGAVVTLTAIPTNNKYEFTGWSGCSPDPSKANKCTVIMDGAKDVIANFAPKTPTLTITKTGEGSVTSNSINNVMGINCGDDCTADYRKGTSVTLTATPADGYNFTWGGSCSGKTAKTCTLTMQDDDRSVTIAFTIKTYNITASTVGSGTISSSVAAAHGSTPAFTMSAAAGWHIDHVEIDKSSVGAVDSYTFGPVIAGHSIKAVFARNKYTLSVTNNNPTLGSITMGGNKCNPSCSQILEYGDKVVLSATPIKKYKFINWSGGHNSSDKSVTITMDADKTVYGDFQLKSYLLTVKKNIEGGSVTSDVAGEDCGDGTEGCLIYDVGTKVTLTASENAAYLFTDWDGACTSNKTTCTITLDKDKTVTAKFKMKTYTLTASKQGSGSISPSGNVTVNYNEGRTFTITPDTNYHIVDVLVDRSSVSAVGSYTFSSVYSGHTIKAIFAENDKYKLGVSKSGTGNGTVQSDLNGINCGSGNGCWQKYYAGTAVTLTATAGVNSTFDGWGGACSGTGTCTVTMNSANDVTATFTKIPTRLLSVTNTNTAGGIVTSDVDGISCGSDCSEDYTKGTVVKLTATKNTGYNFDWSRACNNKPNPCIITMNDDKSVTAKFEIIKYPIDAGVVAYPNRNKYGSISPGDVNVDHGSSQTFTFSPVNANYIIDYVKVDDMNVSISSDSSYTFNNVAAPHKIRVRFKRR